MSHYLENELNDLLDRDGDVRAFVRHSCRDGLWVWDLEDSKHQWMSAEFWQLFGYEPASRTHSPDSCLDIIHPDDAAQVASAVEQFLRDPDQTYDQVVRYRHADGHMIWVRRQALVIRNEHGRPIRMLGAHTDLTGYLLAEKEREPQETAAAARLSTVFNATQTCIIGLGDEGQILTLNRAAGVLLKIEDNRQDLHWPHDALFLKSSDLRPLSQTDSPVRRALSGDVLQGEVFGFSFEDEPDVLRYVRISSAQVSGQATDVKAVIMVEDVTQQERERQQSERHSRLDALTQISVSISHDFNALLLGIHRSLAGLADEFNSETARDTLSSTLHEIERGRDLARRLMAFGHPQQTEQTARLVSRVIDDVTQVARQAVAPQVEISGEQADASLWVNCDLPALENALLSLVINSRDAILRSGQGGRIVIRASHAHDLDMLDDDSLGDAASLHDFIKVTVSDNGGGMTPEVAGQALEPFFTTKGNRSGEGLGLPTVLGFATRAGGRVHLRANDDGGTDAVLILPAGAPPGKTAPETASKQITNRGQGEVILLCEDESTLLKIMTEHLETIGYQVVAVNNAMAAWELVKNGLAFDALVSDVVMAGNIDGYELVQKVAEIRPDIPAFLMSGYAGYGKPGQGPLKAKFLVKPCAPNVLAAELRAALDLVRG